MFYTFYFMIIMNFFISGLRHKVHIQLEADSKKKKKNLDVWTTGSNISKQGKGNSIPIFHELKVILLHGSK